MNTILMGKDGEIVLPEEICKLYNLEDGSIVFLEEREDGFLIRPAAASTADLNKPAGNLPHP